MVRDPCPECRGEGRVEKRRTIEVQIPAGVDHGARLRLAGEGEHGRHGGLRGDLFVVLHVAPHEEFGREGHHVLAEVEVTYAQAVLGASLTVPTLHGEQTLDLPPGTQPGQEFRLRGLGIPRLGGRGRGDHVVHVRLTVPKAGDLSEERLTLLRQLAELEGSAVKADRSVLDRVKELFS